MTQSAVSQQIRALETRLGVTLFRRHARGLSLTDDGRRLLPKVEAALDSLHDATAPFVGPTGTEHLTVAASVSVIDWVIAPKLQDFHARHPGVTVRFLSTIWPDEYRAQRADVEIRFGSQKQVGRDAEELLPNRLIAVKSPLLAGALGDLPLIETVGTTGTWSLWAETHQNTLPDPVYFVDAYGMAMRLAASGNCVALVSSVITKHAIDSGQLHQAHPETIDGQEGYFLSVQRPSAQSQAFSDWVKALV